MAYVKHGTGPNDWKKGNRTKGKDRRGNRKGRPGSSDIEGLIQANADRAEVVDRYKKIAEERQKIVKYNQPYVSGMAKKISDYIEECHETREPLTVFGLIEAADITKEAYYKGKDGRYDYMLYMYMDLNDIPYEEEGNIYTTEDGGEVLLVRMSELLQKAEVAIIKEREIRCSSTKGNPVGNIFLMKGMHGVQDTPPDQRTTNNNTLVLNNVASLDEARDAMKRLNG